MCHSLCDVWCDTRLCTWHFTHNTQCFILYLFTAMWYRTHTHTSFKKGEWNLHVSKLPTGLWTVSLAIEVVTSASYKIYLTFLQAIKARTKYTRAATASYSLQAHGVFAHLIPLFLVIACWSLLSLFFFFLQLMAIQNKILIGSIFILQLHALSPN